MECPKCDADVRPDISYCPECGLHVEKLRKIIARWYCPRCEIEVDPDEGTCRECGLSVAGLRRLFERAAAEEQSDTATDEGGHTSPDDGQETPGDGHDTASSRPADEQQQPGAQRDQQQHAGPDQREDDHTQQAGPQYGETTSHQAQAADGATHRQQAAGMGQPQQHQQSTQHPEHTSQQSQHQHTSQQSQHQHTSQQSQHQHTSQQSQQARTARKQATAAGSGLFDGISIPASIGMGAVAYVANLVAAVLLAIGTFPGAYFQRAAAGPLTVGGWLLYGTHQVPLQAVGPAGGSRTMPFLSRILGAAGSSRLPVPEPVYYLLPMIGLYLAGLVAVRWLSPGGSDLSVTQGASVGVLVAAGYLSLSLVAGQLLFTKSPATARGSIGPALGGTVLFMGILYPVVVGGLGGVVGSR